MTEQQFLNFVEKYNLQIEYDFRELIGSGGLKGFTYSKIKSTKDRYILIANCNSSYNDICQVLDMSLNFYTSNGRANTFERACEIMETVYIPKIKQSKIDNKLNKIKDDF